MTRGMYQADLVKFKSYNLKNDTDNKKEDEYSKFCQDGYDYIVHTRSKNQNRSNNKMLIRIDDTTMIMFKLLKQSVWCTHYDRRKELKLEEDDLLNVFGYDVDDVKLHTGVFDVYQKHCKKLLGVPLKNARKSFNSYAFRLEISQEIRNVLLGHTNPNIIKHYDDLSFIEEQVNAAHISVLKKFEVKTLVNLLEKQFHKVGADFIESESIILDLENFEYLKNFILEHKIDLVIIGPEKPLVDGLVDYLEKFNIVLAKVVNDYLGPSGKKRSSPTDHYMLSATLFAQKCQLWGLSGEDGADDSSFRKKLYKDIRFELAVLKKAIDENKR